MLTRGLLIALLFLTVSPQAEPRHPVHVECLTYPPLARNARIVGDVTLIARVDSEGRVIGAPDQSGGHPVLQTAAAENLQHWRFRPGAVSEFRVTYHFKIEGKPTYNRQKNKCHFDFPDSFTIVTNLPAPNPD